jgi:hypothetical protein
MRRSTRTTTVAPRRSFMSRFTTPRTTRSSNYHTHGVTSTHRATAAPPRKRGGLFGTRRHHATATPVVHHKRHATMGDKISGMMLKLKGSLTGRPAVKV